MTDATEDIDRELRQLSLMKERIEQFRGGSLPLSKLISDLEGLLEARTHASDQWIDDFRSAWSDLEIPYAVALDRLTPIADAHDPTVADGLFDLDRLIHQAEDELRVQTIMEGVTESDRLHVFEQSPGDWWAECLVCGEWVSTSNATRRDAEHDFGRHWQNDHSATAAPNA